MARSEPLDTRAVGCLARLLPHLRPPFAALTGGLAIHLHLRRAGLPSSRRVVSDLDLVAPAPDVVAPSVTSDFLVSHYHLPHQGNSKFLVQLVDPVTRLRVDLFPDADNSLSKAATITLGSISLPIVDAGDILAHKLQTINGASIQTPIDEKHVHDAFALAMLLGQPLPTVPAEHVHHARYATDTTIRCQRCETSARREFPLAPKSQILALLGYV